MLRFAKEPGGNGKVHPENSGQDLELCTSIRDQVNRHIRMYVVYWREFKGVHALPCTILQHANSGAVEKHFNQYWHEIRGTYAQLRASNDTADMDHWTAVELTSLATVSRIMLTILATSPSLSEATPLKMECPLFPRNAAHARKTRGWGQRSRLFDAMQDS